jgi:hypothetical protein
MILILAGTGIFKIISKSRIKQEVSNKNCHFLSDDVIINKQQLMDALHDTACQQQLIVMKFSYKRLDAFIKRVAND